MAIAPELDERTTPSAVDSGPRRPLLRHRSVRWAAAGWILISLAVLILADTVPFEWPAVAERSVTARVVEANAALVQVLLMMWLVVVLTRRRRPPRVVARSPGYELARRETLLLLGYGCCALVGGFVVARAMGWHPFGLHLAGTLYGTHDSVARAEALAWAAYNLVVYAAVPLAVFRRRYAPEQLGLRSTDRKNDRLVIGVVLLVESVFQALALSPAILELTPRELAIGVPLTFGLYLAGAVVPAMVFIYAILIPRLLRLTGSVPATVILGGLTYAVLHIWDAWIVLDSPQDAAVSFVFVVFTYFGPGMIKSVLTVRTGNAWVHVWAYHAIAPHTLIDTPHTANIFGVR